MVLAAILLTFFIDREPDRPLPPASGAGDRLDQLAADNSKTSKTAASPVPAKNTLRAPSSELPAFRQPKEPPGKLQATANKPLPGQPSFDIVRVNPDGDTVIAGRAPPDSVVSVRQGDSVIGIVTADKRGEWVLVPQHPLAAGTHELRGREASAGWSCIGAKCRGCGSETRHGYRGRCCFRAGGIVSSRYTEETGGSAGGPAASGRGRRCWVVSGRY